LCQGNKIIIIQFTNLHALQHRVNYESNMSMQKYKYTETAELHKQNTKQNEVRVQAGLVSY